LITLIIRIIIIKDIKITFSKIDLVVFIFATFIIFHPQNSLFSFPKDGVHMLGLLFSTLLLRDYFNSLVDFNKLFFTIIVASTLIVVASFMASAINILISGSFYFIDESTGWKYYYTEYTRLSIFGHPTYISLFINVGIVSLASVNIKLYIKCCLAVLFIAFNILLLSKAGILSMCLLVIIFLSIAINRKIFNWKQLIFGLGLIAGFIFCYSYFFTLSRIKHSTYELSQYLKSGEIQNSNSSTSIRLQSLEYFLKEYNKQLFIGKGSGALKIDLLEVSDDKPLYLDSQLLNYLYNYGLFGLVLFLFLIFYILFSSLTIRNLLLTVPFIVPLLTENILGRRFGFSLFLVIFLVIMSEMKVNYKRNLNGIIMKLYQKAP
jgi:hypothetical protein